MSSSREPLILKNLRDWIEEQKRILKTLKMSERELEDADRLMLILAARVACYHISRTIRGFESWLQNPLVIGLMPKEIVREMQKRLWNIMYELVEYDIKHTGEYHDFLQKIMKEGKLPPLLFQAREGVRRRGGAPQVPYTL